MNIGDKIFINDSIGEVTVLDIKDNYLILLRKSGGFIKTNAYYFHSGKLVWDFGEYYDSLDKLVGALSQ